MKIINTFRGMSMVKKVGFIASIATILSFGLSLFSNADTVKQTINGDKNTVIGENKANITINYGDSSSNTKGYVLRNKGVSLVLSEPSLDVVTDKSKHVCNAIAGTPITLTGRSADASGIPMWKEIIITSGECAGKKGWASLSVISYE